MTWDLLERLHRTLMLFDTTAETKEMQDLIDRVTAALNYADAYQLRKGASPAPPPVPGNEQGPLSATVPPVVPPLNPVTVMLQHAQQQIMAAMNRANTTVASVTASRDQIQRDILAQREAMRAVIHNPATTTGVQSFDAAANAIGETSNDELN